MSSPYIHIIKLISSDNGASWVEAKSSPGPILDYNINPKFKYTIINSGDVPITNISLIDDVYGPISIPTTTLSPGESVESIITKNWINGQNKSLATVTGSFDTQVLTDTDITYYFGAFPLIQVITFVSLDNGLSWISSIEPPGPTIPQDINPKFKYTVINTGNIKLTNITLNDNIYGPVSIPTTTLESSEYFDVIISDKWKSGEQYITATVMGFLNNKQYSNSDTSYYFGNKSSIQIIKFISVDRGLTWIDANIAPGPLLPPGIIPHFKYIIKNTGSTELTNIKVTDDVLGVIGVIDSLEQGATHEFIVSSF